MRSIQIKEKKNGMFYFVLADNVGMIVLKSEEYTSKRTCELEIKMLSNKPPYIISYIKNRWANGKYVFQITKDNGLILMRSCAFNSNAACEYYINEVQKLFNHEIQK